MIETMPIAFFTKFFVSLEWKMRLRLLVLLERCIPSNFDTNVHLLFHFVWALLETLTHLLISNHLVHILVENALCPIVYSSYCFFLAFPMIGYFNFVCIRVDEDSQGLPFSRLYFGKFRNLNSYY